MDRIAGLLIGVVFGVTLSWTGLSSPEVIRAGLSFQSAYLYLFFASAVLVASAGQWLLRRARARAVITGETVAWQPEAPRRRHILGSVVFGIGWGIAGACPGPIATQVGQGIAWGAATMVGVIAGIVLQLRLRPRTDPGVSSGRGGAGTKQGPRRALVSRVSRAYPSPSQETSLARDDTRPAPT